MAENEVQLIDFEAYVKELEADSSPGAGPDVMLLTCIDWRFWGVVARYMGNVKYDHMILAGASLGAVIPAKESTWGPTFTDHLTVARRLHPSIRRFIALDHRQCGAYGPDPGFGLLPANPSREVETLAHVAQMAELHRRLRSTGLTLEFSILEVPPGTETVTCERLVA